MATPVAYSQAGQRAVPTAEPVEQADTDSETFFTQEVPALQSRRFTRDNASRILQPAPIVQDHTSRWWILAQPGDPVEVADRRVRLQVVHPPPEPDGRITSGTHPRKGRANPEEGT